MQKFSESQLRQVIEKSFYIAQSNNGSVPISKIDDAANFAAYIAGYSSWKKYRKSIENDFSIAKLENESLDDKILFSNKYITINIESIQSLKTKLSSISKIKKEEGLKENKQILSKIYIAESYSKITKAHQPIFLNLQNTGFFGKDNSFINNVINELKQQQQSIIEFDASEDSNIKLDPLNELIVSDFWEDFIPHNSQDHKDFSVVWCLLIKQLSQQYKIKFTADLLLETLDLDFLIKYWVLLSQENNFLSNMLLIYFKSLSIKKENDSKIKLNENQQKNHFKNIQNIKTQMTKVKDLYDSNIFSYNGLFLSEMFIKKEREKLNFPLTIDMFAFDIMSFLISSVVFTYQKQVESLDIKEHAVFLVNKHPLLNKKLVKSDYVVYFSLIAEGDLDNIIDFEQIVFCKQNTFINLSSDFIHKFYLNTPMIEKNLFANYGKVLMELKEGNAFLWKRSSTTQDFGDFDLIKLKVKN